MNLKRKIWLLLAVVIGITLSIDLLLSARQLQAELRRDTSHEAGVVYGFMMATRRTYQQQFVESGLPLNHNTIGFLPAHSFSRISKDFANWNDSGILFNNVSDRPRNPGNQADQHELEDMAWFRANPSAKERLREIRDGQGQGYSLYSAPIWIEPFCLKCHKSAEEAPPSIRELYPDVAYGYQLGDLRGLVSIKIPAQRLDQRFWELWSGRLLLSLIGYLILFLGIGLFIDRLVVSRLQRLQLGAEQIGAGDYRIKLFKGGQDEISELAHSFDRMTDQIQLRSQELTKLSLAVEQSPLSILITDVQAHIEYANSYFLRNSGYSMEEVLGQTPRLLRSGLTPEATYQGLWPALARGEIWEGEFINRRKDGSTYIDETQISPVRDRTGEITHYLAIQRDITHQRSSEEQIHRLANFDALTGLPNRALLLDRLEQALKARHEVTQRAALLLLDIDRFKNLNNALGQGSGDALLKGFAERLSETLRSGETLARLSADEFALLSTDIGRQSGRQILVLAERLHATLEQPFLIGAEQVTISMSIGVVLFGYDPGEGPLDILKRANTAMHRAKQGGGNQTSFFEEDMGEKAEQRFQIERELREALLKDQLSLYLQPQVDAKGTLFGAEVLLRWLHPQRGMVPPGMFIPIAEESDLIIELGSFVLSEAARLIAREGVHGYSLHLSVNISPRHFRSRGFVPWLRDLLEATGADPHLLTLEVTEGLMIDNVTEVVAKMSELAGLGIHFSVDDFGTGYSALAYLKRLPIDEIKIDKSFIQDAPHDPDDAALVETILSVAKHMGLTVVAEGVETAEQAEFLNQRAAGVIHQGYLFGKPEPAEQWIERWQRASS